MSEGFWWAALAVAAASALAHLATMLGTRWGDRAVSSKAFLFSLMAHAALFSGLFAVGPKIDLSVPPTEADEAAEEPDRPIAVTEIFDGTGDPSSASNGSLSAWDRPSESPAGLEERPGRNAELPEPAETARAFSPTPSVVRDVPTPNDLPSPTAEMPEVVEAADADLTARAPEIPGPEGGAAEARAEPRPAPERSEPDPSGADRSEVVERAETPGGRERATPELDPDRQLATLPEIEIAPELRGAGPSVEPARIEPAATPADVPPESIADDGDAAGEVSPSRFTRGGAGVRDFSGEPATVDRESPPGEATASARVTGRDLGVPSFGEPAISRPPAPELRRPEEDGPLGPQGDVIPETYQLRAIEGRSDVARRNGGSAASEAAVEAALGWLAGNQNPRGYWDADAHGAGQVGVDESGTDRKFAGKTADSGVTALAVLAFLGAGHTRDEGPHAETVDRALRWIVANQREDGYLGGEARNFERMYCHGIATYALAEAYGMRSDPADFRLRQSLVRAVAYIAAQQGKDGGWRYAPGQQGDMSMFGWHLMALKSADIAGIAMPAGANGKAVRFLKDRSLGTSGGLAGYLPEQRATPSMTAEALFCKQMLGMTRENPSSVEAVAYLLENAPRRSKLDLYYWYYGTLAMYQYGGPAWEKWNAAVRDLLVAEQVKEGKDAGSWEPRDAWGPYGGRVYSTAVATLSLEVYYRFLPLYRVGGVGADGDAEGPRPPGGSP